MARSAIAAGTAFGTPAGVNPLNATFLSVLDDGSGFRRGENPEMRAIKSKGCALEILSGSGGENCTGARRIGLAALEERPAAVASRCDRSLQIAHQNSTGVGLETTPITPRLAAKGVLRPVAYGPLPGWAIAWQPSR